MVTSTSVHISYKFLEFLAGLYEVQEELLHYPQVSIVNKKFHVKVSKTLYFLNPQMDSLYIWYGYRCWSKISITKTLLFKYIENFTTKK